MNNHTYTGWGSVTHWNAYVANTQMRGKGTFFDPRLNDEKKFPVAVKTKDWNIRNDPDLVTSKLPALHFYQLSIVAPKPPAGSFDAAAAGRGQAVFNGKADCKRCHVPPLFTEPGWPMHTAPRDRDRRLPGEAVARRALPHDPAARAVGAHEGRVLPRRPVRHAAGRDRALQRPLQAETDRGRGQRPGRVPEVALGGWSAASERFLLL